VKDDANDNADNAYDGVIIPFPDPKAEKQTLGPFCDKCRKHHYVRNEGRGKCGHMVFFTGVHFCGRCALMKMICRGCGTDLTAWFSQLGKDREKDRRKPRKEKPGKMKILKR
jgi:hypothetical protein